MKADNVEVSSSVNLVAVVTDLLSKNGHQAPDAWTIGLHPDAYVVADQNVQLFLINRQWRCILSAFGEMTGTVTMDERYCLVDNGVKPSDWLRLFEEGVLPCILKHNLPYNPA